MVCSLSQLANAAQCFTGCRTQPPQFFKMIWGRGGAWHTAVTQTERWRTSHSHYVMEVWPI
eukprot:1254816-Karenia_brevis.AAC.1